MSVLEWAGSVKKASLAKANALARYPLFLVYCAKTSFWR